MALYLFLLGLEMLFLFLLSREVQTKIGRFFYRVFKNKNVAIYAMSVLFLPGTIVHESAHFLVALLLLVPVGQMQLVPKINADSVDLGSVAIAKTDFIRRFFISIAPFVFGTALVLTTVYEFFDLSWYGNFWLTVLISYIVFSVSNTMFISKKDTQGIWGFVIFIILIIIFMILFGINIDLPISQFSAFKEIIRASVLFLSAPVVLDFVILLILK